MLKASIMRYIYILFCMCLSLFSCASPQNKTHITYKHIKEHGVKKQRGVIKGKVYGYYKYYHEHKGTNQPLPGAAVKVQNTNLGAATTLNGTYVIDSLDYGTYSITASMMGFTTETINNVKVFPDKITYIEIYLMEIPGI